MARVSQTLRTPAIRRPRGHFRGIEREGRGHGGGTVGARWGKGGVAEGFRRFSEVKKCKLLRHSPFPKSRLYYPNDSYLTSPDSLCLGPPFSSPAPWSGRDAGGWDGRRRSPPGNLERQSCVDCARAVAFSLRRKPECHPDSHYSPGAAADRKKGASPLEGKVIKPNRLPQNP